MRKMVEKLERAGGADGSLTLPYELRVKSRFRALLDNGEEASVVLPRGGLLQDGDRLRSAAGFVVKVKAARETVSTAISADPLLLARACYHLGNRHVPLQIAAGWVRYQQDPVLDQMLLSLGLRLKVEQAPFQPETGAYGPRHAHETR